MTNCCEEMLKRLVDLSKFEIESHSIIYDKSWRIYTVTYKRPNEEDHAAYIDFCPWCGKKLPTDLADKWFEILESEYGITDPHNTQYDKVPSEFRTDEWWKKRGL